MRSFFFFAFLLGVSSGFSLDERGSEFFCFYFRFKVSVSVRLSFRGVVEGLSV